MVNFLNNLEAAKLVDEYYVTTVEQVCLTIRVVQTVVGAQEFSFKAFPYFALFDSPSTSQFQGVGATANEALQACLSAIDGVSIVSMLTPIAIQQEALKKHMR